MLSPGLQTKQTPMVIIILVFVWFIYILKLLWDYVMSRHEYLSCTCVCFTTLIWANIKLGYITPDNCKWKSLFIIKNSWRIKRRIIRRNCSLTTGSTSASIFWTLTSKRLIAKIVKKQAVEANLMIDM